MDVGISPTLTAGDIVVDTAQRRAGRWLDLSPKEFGVLELTGSRAGPDLLV